MKQPGKYYPIEIDYSQVPEDTAESTAKPAGANSKLTVQVQNLVKMIFDIEAMKATMEEFKVFWNDVINYLNILTYTLG